ncbi:hypothetical protein [Acinetobacter sp. HY1485]|uniref:hypothetical protein n=1 Tax=Acinetobacter sp. HY1485 TaxID=2970918 RepID=UPI0022B967A6|nr:hypothetical protein [Acinetobacter sp. HY1485]
MSLFPVAITHEQGREIEIARLHAKLETTARRLERLSLQQDEDAYRLYDDGKFVAVLKNRGSMSLDLKIDKTAGVSNATIICYLNENLDELLHLEANTLKRIDKISTPFVADTQNNFADLAPKTIITDAVLEA